MASSGRKSGSAGRKRSLAHYSSQFGSTIGVGVAGGMLVLLVVAVLGVFMSSGFAQLQQQQVGLASLVAAQQLSYVDSLVDAAVEAVQRNDLDGGISKLMTALRINSEDAHTNQLLGTVYAKMSQPQQSIFYLNRSLELSGWKDSLVGANYIEVLRSAGFLDEANRVGWKLLQLHPASQHGILYFNLGVVQEHLDNYEVAARLHIRAINVEPTYKSAWKNLFALYLHDLEQYDNAEQVARQGLIAFPDDLYFRMALGLSLQYAVKLDEAIQVFKEVLAIDPNHYNAKSSLGAVYQVYGKAQLALEAYESAMPFKDNDSAIRNNYGALLGVMGRKAEEVRWLKESLQIEPNMAHALINLGGYYQDEGRLDIATSYFTRAIALNYQTTIVSLRISLLMYPICDSWQQMITGRIKAQQRLIQFITENMHRNVTKSNLDASIDRIHFYIVYHGLNDRRFQELVVQAYRIALTGFEVFAPQFIAGSVSPAIDELHHEIVPLGSASLSRRVKIGFISKFFGIFEPHALLLDGVMKNLPRSRFEVYALPVHRTDTKPLTPSIVEAADHIVEISLKHEHAMLQLSQLDLDILVFADTMGEPMTHFLAHSRIARVQVKYLMCLVVGYFCF
jgi:tetratricopeptide (TPR) repeat protein